MGGGTPATGDGAAHGGRGGVQLYVLGALQETDHIRGLCRECCERKPQGGWGGGSPYQVFWSSAQSCGPSSSMASPLAIGPLLCALQCAVMGRHSARERRANTRPQSTAPRPSQEGAGPSYNVLLG